MKYLKKLNENVLSFEDLDLEEIKNLLNILKDDGVPFECKLGHRDSEYKLASSKQFHKNIYSEILPEQTELCKIPMVYVMIYPYKGTTPTPFKNIPLQEHINIITERFESISEFMNRVVELYEIKTPSEGILSFEGRPVYKITIVGRK